MTWQCRHTAQYLCMYAVGSFRDQCAGDERGEIGSFRLGLVVDEAHLRIGGLKIEVYQLAPPPIFVTLCRPTGERRSTKMVVKM